MSNGPSYICIYCIMGMIITHCEIDALFITRSGQNFNCSLIDDQWIFNFADVVDLKL